ncbi:MAG: NYN domain-containing protein [Fimbriimonadaceae bacterium]
MALRNLAALFVDFENIFYFAKNKVDSESEPQDVVLELIHALRDHFRKSGCEPIVMKSYADFGQLPENVQQSLYLSGVEPRYVLGTEHKNAADMLLCIEVMESFYRREDIDTFVLVAGDRDYIPLIQHLKEGGKTVLVCSFEQNLSGDLVQVIGEENVIRANELVTVQLKMAAPERKATVATGTLTSRPEELRIPAPQTSFLAVDTDLTEDEEECLLLMLEEFGQHQDIWMTPFLRRYGEVATKLQEYERKITITDLKEKGAIAVLKREGHPRDYSVINVNYNHPIVQKLNPGV